jgi:hypothetical protein
MQKFIRNSEGNRPFGRPRLIWDNIKMGFNETEWDIRM